MALWQEFLIQNFRRVTGISMRPEFKVEVRAGGSSGLADVSDDLAGTHDLAGADKEVLQMRVDGFLSIFVAEAQDVAVTGTHPGL